MDDEFDLQGGSEDGGNEESGQWLNDRDEGDDVDADEPKETMVLNPTSVRERIDAALEILSDFKNRPDKSQSRADLVSVLAKDLSEYYGYIPELAEFLLDLFSPAECVEYMDASDRPRPLVIRTNTIKTTRKDLMEALTKRGATLEAVEWSKVAIKVTESSVPIGATPEYLAGYYMLQSAASMNPVMALAPQPGERVLDMSAAPGGKTSYIAQLMKNSGTIIANDLKPQRQKATVANLHRMGVKTAIVCCYDGRKIPKVMKGFDRVLLDAPCSGLGVISRDQSVKLQRTVKDIQRIAHLQKELLCAAVDAVDHTSTTGGIVVYSTCSISCEENEQVVDYILKKRFVRLIGTGLEVGKSGLTRYKEKRFPSSMALTKRFYPHVHNMDGFFVAKLQKYGHGVRSHEEDKEEEEEEEGEEEDGSEMDVDEEESKPSKKEVKKEVKKEEKKETKQEKAQEKPKEKAAPAVQEKKQDLKVKTKETATPAVAPPVKNTAVKDAAVLPKGAKEIAVNGKQVVAAKKAAAKPEPEPESEEEDDDDEGEEDDSEGGDDDDEFDSEGDDGSDDGSDDEEEEEEEEEVVQLHKKLAAKSPAATPSAKKPEPKKPESVAKKPESAVKKPEPVAKKPESAVKKPESAVKKPEPVAKKPESAVKKAELVPVVPAKATPGKEVVKESKPKAATTTETPSKAKTAATTPAKKVVAAKEPVRAGAAVVSVSSSKKQQVVSEAPKSEAKSAAKVKATPKKQKRQQDEDEDDKDVTDPDVLAEVRKLASLAKKAREQEQEEDSGDDDRNDHDDDSDDDDDDEGRIIVKKPKKRRLSLKDIRLVNSAKKSKK